MNRFTGDAGPMLDAPRSRRFAVLIDADNTSPRIAAGLFEEIARFGEATVRRIYGDFSSTRLRSWSEILQKFAIDPYQQFAYTSGKNASDMVVGQFDGERYCFGWTRQAGAKGARMHRTLASWCEPCRSTSVGQI
jgi:hypothetical protein